MPRTALLVVCLGLTAAACAPRLIRLPTDPGSPFPDFAQVHAEVSTGCAGARTWQAQLDLTGRAAGERLRGRVHVGFERPASVRLEAVAPFGPPVFILAARDGRATLLLPREGWVVLDAAPEALLGALTGVALGPADLLAVLTGCVTADPRPVSGQLHDGGWASILLEGDARLYLRRRGGQWEVRAAEREGWRFEYAEWLGNFPRRVRLQDTGQDVDLTAAVAQLEVNTGIPAAAFELVVSPQMVPVSLEELRDAGPLREADEAGPHLEHEARTQNPAS